MSPKKYAHKLSYSRAPRGITRWGVVMVILIIAIVAGLGVRFFRWDIFGLSRDSARQPVLKDSGSIKGGFALAPYFLGFDKSRTFLLLFLNNTEMRPGGGFIGSYGILKINKGKIFSFTTSGSENLDWNAPKDFVVEPPPPIIKYLAQPLWYFRDSNWSPDFKESSESALRFYAAEGGAEASALDGVIGLTPTVLKGLLAVMGALDVNGKTYVPEKVVEELEYHVEYGYKDAGQQVAERKTLIGEMGSALMQKITSVPPWRWKSMLDLFENMVKEKHVMLFSKDAAVQKTIENLGWGGRQADIPMSTDFVQVVDANLASLKTDAVIDRAFTYSIRRAGNEWVGEFSAAYAHTGARDWKTTRYRSFTRLYVPASAALRESAGFVDDVKSKKPMSAEAVVEGEKQSFGGFWFVEPGMSETIRWVFALPAGVQEQLNAGVYKLYAQKQLGLERAPRLTVQVDFGTTVRRFEGDLSHDQIIEFKR